MPIPRDWVPSAETVAELRRGRPDLVGAHYEAELRAFQLWCSATAATSHDAAATFLRFMHKARRPADTQGPRPAAFESFDDRRIREARAAVAS